MRRLEMLVLTWMLVFHNIDKGECMKQERLLQITNLLEKAVALILLLAIGVSTLLYTIKAVQGLTTGDFRLEYFMEGVMTLVVGIEFARMLMLHTAQSVIEVLLYAVARQIVIYHDSALDNLFGVGAIALIFVIQKYLLDPNKKLLGSKHKSITEHGGIEDEGQEN